MERRLAEFLRSHCTGGVALAFSGGVDSALLLHALIRLRKEKDFPLVAFFFRTPFQTSQESRESLSLAIQEGCEYEQIDINPLHLPELRKNPPERCYICKRALFTALVARARERGLGAVMDGTNADDLKQYRPGLRALRELGVLSPLAETGRIELPVVPQGCVHNAHMFYIKTADDRECAALELGVVSPLAEAGMGKGDVRALASR